MPSNQHTNFNKVITTRLVLWAKQFMNIPTQEWGYLFFELQCHTTSMALEHIWAIITHTIHNIPLNSLNPSPSSPTNT